MPCLAFAPAPGLWAEYLVHRALVAYAEGGRWEVPLGEALGLAPGIDRGVGPDHPMFSWTPPPGAEPSSEPVPAGVRLYVDGQATVRLPPSTGLHLVQRTDGRFWSSRLVAGPEGLDEWLEAPIERPPHVATWVDAGVGGGALATRQRPEVADWYPEVADRGAIGTLSASARATFRSPFGLAGEAFVPLAAAGGEWATVRAAGLASDGPWSIELGGAAVRAVATSADEAAHALWLGCPVAGGAVSTGGDWSAELAIAGGAFPSIRMADAGVALVGPGRSWRPRLEARALWARADLVEKVGRTGVLAEAWVASVGVGAAWSTEP